MSKVARRLTYGGLSVLLALAVTPELRAQPADHLQHESHSEELPATEPASSPLTLQVLEQWALERNPTLVQAEAQVGVSRGKALQAGLYPNPTVGYTAEQIGADGTAGELQGIFVQQEIVRGNKLQLSRAKYRQEAAQAEIRHEGQQYRVLASVRKAFYQALVTQRQVQVREELLANAQDAVTTTKGLLNVGQANQPDLLQAEVQESRIRAELRAAKRHLRGHWQELAAYVGIPELVPTTLDGELEISEQDVLNEDATLQDLLQCSPDLRAAWSEVERDRFGLQREMVEPIPNLQLRGETGYNFESQDTVAGVSVGVRLPIWDKNQGSIFQARAELARAEADVARVELMLRRKFGEVFADYEAALIEARILRKESLPKARQAYELYQAAFEKRRAAWPQVLVAQREYFQLTDEYLQQLLQLRRAEADITGFFLGDGLDQPQAPAPQGHRDATPRPR